MGRAKAPAADDVQARLTTLSDALADETVRADLAVSAWRDRQARLDELQSELRAKISFAEDIEKQVRYSHEHNRLLLGELAALNERLASVEAARAQSDCELSEARARIEALGGENHGALRVQEEMAERIARLLERDGERKAALDKECERRRLLEEKLAASVDGTTRTEARAEAERAAGAAERADLLAKLDRAETDKSSAEACLARMREALCEREEAERAALRDLRSAASTQEMAERRLESAKLELARHKERLADLQRQRAESAARGEALAYALSDAEASLALARRTHAEDLLKERAERALVQRALEIARSSRASLEKRHEALRRSGLGWREAFGQDDAPAPDGAARNVQSLYRVK